jgi:hypothetical protein
MLHQQITKNWVRKLEIRKMSQLGKVRKSNKLFKSANLRICNLGKLFVDRPPLVLRNNQYYEDWVGGHVGILLIRCKNKSSITKTISKASHLDGQISKN